MSASRRSRRSFVSYWVFVLPSLLLALPSKAEVFEVPLPDNVFTRESGPPVTRTLSFSIEDPDATYVLTKHDGDFEDDEITSEFVKQITSPDSKYLTTADTVEISGTVFQYVLEGEVRPFETSNSGHHLLRSAQFWASTFGDD